MVYVVQEVAGKNILPASRYGELEVLLPSVDVVLSPGPTISTLKRKLSRFCDDDYLLLIGDPCSIAMCAMVASQANGGRVKLLKWDRQTKLYYPIEVRS